MAQDDKTRAQQLIDKNSDFGGLNVDALCNELSRIIMQLTYTVFEVFEVLTERGFDQAAHERVANNLIDRINEANLIQLAQSIHGQIVLQRIWYILNCQANSGQRTCQLIAVADARAKENEQSSTPRQLSQEELDWYANYNEGKDAPKSGAKKPFKPEVCWQLPRQGIGYVVYSPDDLDNAGRKRLGQVLLNDKYGYDQIGTKETIEAMIRIAKEWSALHPDKLLQYGDVARPGGINTPDHHEHNTGKAFDMRLLRKDKLLEGLTYTQTSIYNRELTKEFILLAVKLYPGTTVYFNDKVLNSDDADTRNLVDPSAGHNDHLHIMFPGGKE